MRWLLRLFGWKSRDEVWQDCVLAEARSRGLQVERITNDAGELVAFRLIDGRGTWAVAAYK